MQTITLKMLESSVNRINTMTNNPIESYSKIDDKYTANIGNYHLSGAYGGYALHRMHNQNGGVQDVFQCGHVSKRDLLNRIQAFINGYSAADNA